MFAMRIRNSKYETRLAAIGDLIVRRSIFEKPDVTARNNLLALCLCLCGGLWGCS